MTPTLLAPRRESFLFPFRFFRPPFADLGGSRQIVKVRYSSGEGRQKVVDRVPGLLALSADPLFLVVVDTSARRSGLTAATNSLASLPPRRARINRSPNPGPPRDGRVWRFAVRRNPLRCTQIKP